MIEGLRKDPAMSRSPEMKLAEQGFTMIEMVVVMAIIATLAGLAIYTYIPMIGRLRLSTDVRKVDQALQQAKMHALSNGVPAGVDLLPSRRRRRRQ